MTEPTSSSDQASITLRDIGPDDVDWLLRLNNASVPHVNHLERADLTDILSLAAYARCVVQSGQPAGALIGLWPGTTYDSHHYRWFEQRHDSFLYIDRVMIDASTRKGGHGRRLYADIDNFARLHDTAHIACEVNSQPPNPVSMHFHEAMGFHPVGELTSEGGSKTVVMMLKTL